MSQSNHRLSGGLSTAAITVSGACLTVSAFQGANFIQRIVPDAIQATAMVGGIVAILIGSQIIARMTGQALMARVPAWAVLAGLLCIGAIEALSVATSTTAFSGGLIEARRSQNLESPEYRQAQQNIANYQRQIDSLMTAMSEMPATYATKRKELSAEVRTLQRSLERQQALAAQLDVSTSGAAFDALEGNTGLSPADVSLIAAVLLSAVPLVLNLLGGAFVWSQRDTGKEGSTGKKRVGRPQLKTVA